METYMKKILFLIIDMQNGFLNRNTEGIDRRILEFLEKIQGRAAVAGTRYVNNEHTACGGHGGSGDPSGAPGADGAGVR